MKIEIDPRLGEVKVSAELSAKSLQVNLIWGERYLYGVHTNMTSHPEDSLTLLVTESEDGPIYRIEFIPETTEEKKRLGSPGIMLTGRHKETEVVVFLKEWWLEEKRDTVVSKANKQQ